MNFTFGIITGGGQENNINKIINSIEKQNIPHYEIIIIGNCLLNFKNIIQMNFDENIKSTWITKKKNIITNLASYENIVYIHDYIMLSDNWYNGFLRFGNNFNLCMTPILNLDNTRYRDWTLFQYDAMRAGISPRRFMLPYDETSLSKYMYFSGAYWVGKKQIMKLIPFDESLSWGQGEDVIWSMQIRNRVDFSINPYSMVKLLKQKERIYDEATIEDINMFKEKIRLGYITPTQDDGEAIKTKIRTGII